LTCPINATYQFFITIALPIYKANFKGFLPEGHEACQGPFDGCPVSCRNPTENMFILKPKRGRPQNKGYENSSNDDVPDETLIEKREN